MKEPARAPGPGGEAAVRCEAAAGGHAARGVQEKSAMAGLRRCGAQQQPCG